MTTRIDRSTPRREARFGAEATIGLILFALGVIGLGSAAVRREPRRT